MMVFDDEYYKRRVYISERDFMGGIGISFIDRAANVRSVEHYDPAAEKWKRVPVEEHTELPGPTIKLDLDDAHALYQKLHDFFSARGVRNKDESFVAGDLKATKYHLEDLRTLLAITREGKDESTQ